MSDQEQQAKLENWDDAPLTRRRLIGAASAGALLLAVGGAQKAVGAPTREAAAGRAAARRAGTTLTIATPTIPATLDYEGIRGFEDTQAVVNEYDQLGVLGPGHPGPGGAIVLDPNPLHVRGGLAERIERKPDGLTTILHIRKGVKSALGNEMTADDVIWSLDRAYHNPFKFLYDVVQDVKSYRKIDSYTVEVKQTKPNLLLFSGLVSFWATVFDSKEVKKHVTKSDPYGLKWLTGHTAGFGRYQVTEYAPGDKMIFEANANYWGPKPHFTKLVFNQVDQSANRLALLLRGQVDVAEQLAAKELEAVRKNSKTQVFDADVSTLFLAVYMNWKNPVTRNPLLRQAIYQAIPTEAIIDKIYFEHATLARSPMSPANFGYTGRYFKYPYDPDKAKQLIGKIGKVPKLSLLYETARPQFEQIAAVLQSALRKVGLDVELDGVPSATFSKRSYAHDYELELDIQYPVVADAVYQALVFNQSKSPFAFPSYGTPEVDALIAKAKNELSITKRTQYAHQIQKVLQDDVAQATILYPGTHLATRKGITGYELYPDTVTRYWGLKEA